MGRGRPSRAERRHCSHARSRRRDCARHRHRGRRARARVVAAQVRGPSTRLNRGVANGESDAAFLEREGSRLGFRRLRQERLLVAAHRRRGERASCGRPRHGVIAFTGLWSDPRAGATTSACVSSEPQVWLLGYAPVTYWAEDRLISELRVVPAPGYQIVVMTGTIRPRLVVADNMKVTRPPQRCPRRRNRSDSSSRKNVSRARRHTQKGRCRARRAGSSRVRT